MTLDELLQQAREKSDAATAGPWSAVYNIYADTWQVGRIRNHTAEALIDEKSSEFCAFARTALPLLVKIVERQRESLDRWGGLGDYRSDIQQLIEKEMKP